jgi:hypothetical protein
LLLLGQKDADHIGCQHLEPPWIAGCEGEVRNRTSCSSYFFFVK